MDTGTKISVGIGIAGLIAGIGYYVYKTEIKPRIDRMDNLMATAEDAQSRYQNATSTYDSVMNSIANLFIRN